MNSPAINELTVESGSKTLWHEFLTSYFDGNNHTVGGQSVAFPSCSVAFDQSAPEQPMDSGESDTKRAEIRVITVSNRERNYRTGDTSRVVWGDTIMHFWIRARARTRTQNSNGLADEVSQLLKAILTNPSTRSPLAAKGIARLEPRKPVAVANDDYAVRLVSVRMDLRYELNHE